MEDSIFTKIINREVPSEVVYEDADTLAFMDTNPDVPGHTLVVPKKQARNIFDIDSESWSKVMETTRKLAPVVRDAVGATGMQVRMNNEASAGQVVFHAHVHLIPFHEGQPKNFPEKKPAEKSEIVAVAEKIRAALS